MKELLVSCEDAGMLCYVVADTTGDTSFKKADVGRNYDLVVRALKTLGLVIGGGQGCATGPKYYELVCKYNTPERHPGYMVSSEDEPFWNKISVMLNDESLRIRYREENRAIVFAEKEANKKLAAEKARRDAEFNSPEAQRKRKEKFDALIRNTWDERVNDFNQLSLKGKLDELKRLGEGGDSLAMATAQGLENTLSHEEKERMRKLRESDNLKETGKNTALVNPGRIRAGSFNEDEQKVSANINGAVERIESPKFS